MKRPRPPHSRFVGKNRVIGDPKAEHLRQLESIRESLAQLARLADAHAAIESPTWTHVETTQHVAVRLRELIVSAIHA